MRPAALEESGGAHTCPMSNSGLLVVLVVLLFSIVDLCFAGIVRLTNGTYGHEGRVEVYSNGQWHTVCGWRSDSKLDTADVICRDLGYSFAIHPSDTDNFGQGSTSMLSIPVFCDSSEKTLEECTFKYDHICPHSRDIGVVCSRNPLKPGSVRLDGTISYKSYACGEVQVYLDSRWGGICDTQSTWNEVAAEIACKQMGFDGLIKTRRTYYYKTKQVIGSLYCTGKESELLECHFNREIPSRYCTPPKAVGVMACCYYKTFTLWFSIKLLSFFILITCVPIWVCIKSGWCDESANSSHSMQTRVQPYQDQVVQEVEEVQYSVRKTVIKRTLLQPLQ